ncbi:MAG: hypothetical protein AAGA97_00450 [Pseudomonadota bacterium]
MLKIKLTAIDHYDLTAACNEILDGVLGVSEGEDFDLIPTMVPPARAFAGGNDRIPVVEMVFKKPIPEDERARLQAELAQRYGDRAQITIKDKASPAK